MVKGDHLEILLRALDPETSSAGVAYRQLHQRLIRFFRINNGSDPEALADQSLDRLAARLADSLARQSPEDPDEIISPHAFALGIARHILQEDIRRQRRDTEAATGWATHTLGQPGHHEDLLSALDQCMALMREDQRTLLRSYYQWTGQEKILHHRKVAEKLGLTLNAMRNRLMRARTELDKCLHRNHGDVFAQNNTRN